MLSPHPAMPPSEVPLHLHCRRGRGTKPALRQFRPLATSRAVARGPTTWLERTHATVPSRPGLPCGEGQRDKRPDPAGPCPGLRAEGSGVGL